MKVLYLLLLSFFVLLAEGTAEEKTVTIINARTAIDGDTEMYTELLEQCIDDLPSLTALVPTTSSKSVYLRSINGKKGADHHVKMYSAAVSISYIEAQKMLLVLVQESIQAQEPKTEIYDKRIKKQVRFTSDSNNGKSFANQSNRVYYFDTAEAAKADVISQAQAWLSQNSAALCK